METILVFKVSIVHLQAKFNNSNKSKHTNTPQKLETA